MNPGPEQPFYWAYFAFSPASPSVGTHISNLHPPSFFWLWGESHAKSLEWDEKPSCGQEPDHVELLESGAPRLRGEAIWSLEGEEIRKSLSDSSPEPLQNPLSPSAWSNASVREGANSSPLFSSFSLQFDGSVIMPYWRTELRHVVVKRYDTKGGLISESCESNYHSSLTDYSYGVASAKSYGVENGALLSVKISPADREQLSIGSALRRVDFSSRRPLLTSISLNSTPISTTRYSDYAYLHDGTGFLFINRTEREPSTRWDSPPSSPFSLPPSSFSPLMSVNSSSFFLCPTALDPFNRTYAYQYQHKLVYPFPLGPSNISLVWQDDFNDKWNASWLLLTRSQTGIVGSDAAGASAVVLDPRAPPAELEKIENGPLLSAKITPTNQMRGAQAFYLPSISLPLLAGGLLLSPLAFYLFILMRPHQK